LEALVGGDFFGVFDVRDGLFDFGHDGWDYWMRRCDVVD
jgi:hypothetical protein